MAVALRPEGGVAATEAVAMEEVAMEAVAMEALMEA